MYENPSLSSNFLQSTPFPHQPLSSSSSHFPSFLHISRGELSMPSTYQPSDFPFALATFDPTIYSLCLQNTQLWLGVCYNYFVVLLCSSSVCISSQSPSQVTPTACVYTSSRARPQKLFEACSPMMLPISQMEKLRHEKVTTQSSPT